MLNFICYKSKQEFRISIVSFNYQMKIIKLLILTIVAISLNYAIVPRLEAEDRWSKWIKADFIKADIVAHIKLI